jgi:multicomponent K+:H+ antiporter subunit A
VNVILVDFRGFDTMGEIAVLGIAALGILVLLAAWTWRGARTNGRAPATACPLSWP